MGDNYELKLRCAGCTAINEHWHAESSGSTSFICSACKEINWVVRDWRTFIVTPETEKELYRKNGFG